MGVLRPGARFAGWGNCAPAHGAVGNGSAIAARTVWARAKQIRWQRHRLVAGDKHRWRRSGIAVGRVCVAEVAWLVGKHRRYGCPNDARRRTFSRSTASAETAAA